MIDHVYLPVSDVERSAAFYRALLATLGIEDSFTLGGTEGFGLGGPGALWLYPATGRAGVPDDPCGLDPEAGASLPRLHVAFRAGSRHQVRGFFEEARRLGAEIVEAPRLFPGYHPNYYAAFVRDPDGHNLEAVSGSPE